MSSTSKAALATFATAVMGSLDADSASYMSDKRPGSFRTT